MGPRDRCYGERRGRQIRQYNQLELLGEVVANALEELTYQFNSPHGHTACPSVGDYGLSQ